MSPLRHCPPSSYVPTTASLIIPLHERANHTISDSIASLYFYFVGCFAKISKNSKCLPISYSRDPLLNKIWVQNSSVSTTDKAVLLMLKTDLITITVRYNLRQPLPRTLSSTTIRSRSVPGCDTCSSRRPECLRTCQQA